MGGNPLNPGIVPAAAVDGISFTVNATQDFTIISDTAGTAGKEVTEDNANGGDDAVAVTSTGYISHYCGI